MISLSLTGVLFDHIDFLLIERISIIPENIMEPNRWFFSPFWGTPWIYCVCFTTHETPVDSSNIHLMEERNMSLKLTSNCTSHIFSTDKGPSIHTKRISYGACIWNIGVHMKCDNIRLSCLKII